MLHMPYKSKLSNQEMGNLSWLMFWSDIPALHRSPRLSREKCGFPYPQMGESDATLIPPPFCFHQIPRGNHQKLENHQ